MFMTEDGETFESNFFELKKEVWIDLIKESRIFDFKKIFNTYIRKRLINAYRYGYKKGVADGYKEVESILNARQNSEI